MVSTLNINAVGLGNGILYQSYFVCVKESPEGTLIEYGKSQGFTKNRDVFLAMNDTQNPFYSRFYSFGNGEDPVQVVDVHVLSRRLSNVKCRGDTKLDEKTNLCVQDCHELCDPAQGMQKNKNQNRDLRYWRFETNNLHNVPSSAAVNRAANVSRQNCLLPNCLLPNPPLLSQAGGALSISRAY